MNIAFSNNIGSSLTNMAHPCLDQDVTYEEVRSAIKKLKKQKAPGYDRIQNEHILYGGDNLVKLLAKMFNAILKLEYIPSQWRTGTIIPIFKGKGKNETQIDSYRPVTLLPCLYKLFERVCDVRMKIFFKTLKDPFPHPYQHGFQSGYSCMTASFCLQETVDFNLSLGNTVYAALLDTKSAFDTVRHNVLFNKLYELGISGKLWRVLLNCYTDIKCSVLVHGINSTMVDIKQGVRQGGVSSSTFYLVFIDELFHRLERSKCGAKINHIDTSCPSLADDITMLAIYPNNLQTMLNIAYDYSREYGFEFNSTKTVLIAFKGARKGNIVQL
jgi:hypothetical protein